MRTELISLAVLCVTAAAHAADFNDKQADFDALPTVPVAFKVTLFAREPLVRQPCSMAFDARGRLFVGMGPQYRNPTPETPGDSVVIVLDTDGDGQADRIKVFATGFNAVQGLAWHGRDLWVANAPDLTVVRDLDGDDEADEYVRVYTDLGNLEHGLHGLMWAPDGKLYMSKGNSKGMSEPGRVAPKPFRDLWGVTAPRGAPDFPEPQVFSKHDYKHAYHDPADDWGMDGGVLRCDDGGANLEIVSRGFRNPWDIALDDGFNWLGTDNDQTTGDRVFMPFDGAHFGWNHPWSSHWSAAPHTPTAPVSGPLFEGSGTGVVFGDSPQFPPEYRGVFFINDWLRKTTFVWRPDWDGALMRPRGGDWEPFIVGGKSLFRPTDIEFGPDGALWVLGWSSGYGAEWKDGQLTNEGRIFRIAWKEAPPVTATAAGNCQSLKKRPVAELIDDFSSPLSACRIDAQEELVRRGVRVRDALLETLRSGRLSKMQQTWTAWTLGRIAIDDTTIDQFFAQLPADDSGKVAEGWKPSGFATADDLRPSAKSEIYLETDAKARAVNLRIQAVRILGERARRGASFAGLDDALRSALVDGEPRVRMAAVQAVLRAGRNGKDRHEELCSLLERESDATVFYAVWQTLRRLLSEADLRSLLDDPRGPVQRAALLALLETHALSRQEVTDVLDTAEAARGELLFRHAGGAGCFKCHSLDDARNAFGPNLGGVGLRANDRHLVQSIIEPNAVITEGFTLQTVLTHAGKTFSGVLLEESGLSVSLGMSTGERVDIPKSQIDERRTSRESAMPSMANILTAQQVADVAAFLAMQKTDLSKPVTDPDARFSVTEKRDRLNIALSGQSIVEFVFSDPKIHRPYFAQVRTPSGLQVTRNHPPVAGVDATDHDTMHPGIWLAFGDVSGHDFWRNKGRIEHLRFTEPPTAKDKSLTFATQSRLRSLDGSELCRMLSRFELHARPAGWLLRWEATFQSDTGEFSFGDQEEMGFGARVATPLTEKNGGVITSSTGRRTAASTWGQAAAWCDYSGSLGEHPVGITLIPDRDNFRASWWHNRDYGVFVANPFGRAAMKQGDKSSVTIARGQPFCIRFTAVIHEGRDFTPDAEFRATQELRSRPEDGTTKESR